MKEEELKNEVLIPLLKAMGFQDVTDNHGGSGEQGKDIVCWKVNELGSRKNLAIVAKAVRLTGKAAVGSGTVGEVQTQIQQCFGKPYADSVTGEQCYVHECWVVSNQKIGKEFVDSITSVLSPSTLNRSVSYIDGDNLWKLVEKYLPVSLMQVLDETNKIITNVDTHYQPHVYLTGTETHISLHEKFPGAAEEKPIKIKGRFVFPNTPEGNAARSAVEHFFATGTPVELSPEFIDSIEFPDFYEQIFDISNINIHAFGMMPAANDTRVPVRIEISSEDRDDYILPYIELRMVQSGTHEMTLANDQQPIAVQVRLVLRPEDRGGTLNISTRDVPLNAMQLLEVLELHTQLNKSTLIRIISLELGVTFFDMRKMTGEFASSDPRFVNLVRDLATIQKKLNRPIIIPDRDFTEGERESIAKLRNILHTGEVEGTWSELTIAISVTQVGDITEHFSNGKSHMLFIRAQEDEVLFNTELPLGTARYLYHEAVLADELSFLKNLNELAGSDVPINIAFVPGENKAVTVHYLDWLAQDPFDKGEQIS